MSDDKPKINFKVYETPFHENTIPFNEDIMKMTEGTFVDDLGRKRPCWYISGLFNPPTPIKDAFTITSEDGFWWYQVKEVEENNGRWTARVTFRGGGSGLSKLKLKL